MWYDWLVLLELDGDNDVMPKYTWGPDLAGQWGGQTSSLSSLEGAGGTLDPIASRQGQVGGLLAVHDPEDDPTPDKNYVFFYDATLDTPFARQGQASNVGQLIDWENDGDVVAKYEYDPYGGDLLDPDDPNESGPYAAANPFRFSSKYFDAETALGYSGYRYYRPCLGRFLNRDPITDLGVRLVRRIAVTSALTPRASLAEQGNVYCYVRNGPSNWVDPLGLQTSQPASQPCCYCGPDITDAMIDHLNAFIRNRRGDLSFWPPTGAGVLHQFARDNGGRFWTAATNYRGRCGAGPCKGTVTLCDLCMSGIHIDHILIMAYISENYAEWIARNAGERYEELYPNPPDITAADLAFNELALCFARAMGPAYVDTNYTVDRGCYTLKTVHYPTDYLEKSELCACVKDFGADQREVIANKPGKGSGVTDYEDCIPCGDSISKPAGLELPPFDPY